MPSTSRSGVESVLLKVSWPVWSSKSAMSVKVPPISAASRIFPLECKSCFFIPAHFSPSQILGVLLSCCPWDRYFIKIWIDWNADQHGRRLHGQSQASRAPRRTQGVGTRDIETQGIRINAHRTGGFLTERPGGRGPACVLEPFAA